MMPNVGDQSGPWTWNGARWACEAAASPPIPPCPPGAGPWCPAPSDVVLEAPLDGKLYGRENAAWKVVPGSSGASVTSFNTRTGDVVLAQNDIILAGGAPLVSPAFTGIPTAPTPVAGTNNTDIATTAFVAAAVAAGGGGGGGAVAFWKNIKVDFGAAGDGVTDDSGAFIAFNTWAVAQTGAVFLVIPPGTYMLSRTLMGPTQARGGADFYRGIKELVIWGYGATLNNFMRPHPYVTAPTATTPGAGAPLATVYINAVNAGATAVTALNAWPASTFNVGDMVTVASLEMLGNAGAPATWYYFEYCRISAISGNTLTFADPLTHTHLSTYPRTLNPATPSPPQYDTGGPAAVFQMTQDWDQSVKVMGLTFANNVTLVEFQLCCRRGEMIDCKVVQPAGGLDSLMQPTVCRELTMERCQLGPDFEPDKLIGILRLINCSGSKFRFTSSSFEKLFIDGCHIGFLQYLPKNSEIINSNIATLTLQGPGQGIPNTCIIDNCVIGVLNPWSASIGYIRLTDLTFANGRFSILKTQPYNTYKEIFQNITPGQKMFFGQIGASTRNWGNPFIILAIGEDANSVWFDTTLPALPVYTSSVGLPDVIVPHPCSRFSARSATGSRQAVQLAKADAELPLYSYVHNVYGADLAYPVDPILCWGTLVSLTVNVITADTGPNATLMFRPCSSCWYVSPTNTIAQYNPGIDIKTAGKRVITPTAVTGSAGADAMGAAPGAIWFAYQSVNPSLSASIAGQTAVQMPLVEIELITDQGVTKLAYNALAHA